MTAAEPLLRTLAPALRHLERNLRAWLDSPHGYPYSMMTRAALEGLATDLRRQAEALDVDKPLLVIMLMGGTGVGKSTLLNALAGGAIAQASFARPTTRDPVVYFHESIKPDRLDKALQQCRLVPHNRPGMEQKIIVDTPDLDSNDLSNREKLKALLPVADVVLYVGSQEKYHDRLGWDLFREQRRRRAFAFVLNKWDRCLHVNAAGVRPDEDLLADLRSEGFQHPLLFRTCAQHWVDQANGAAGSANAHPVAEGEQFGELVHWLDSGLTRLEIEAIKARGVLQFLRQLQGALESACPPELGDTAERTRAGWERHLAEEAEETAQILLNTLEPYQREVEHHFTVESQRRFRGVMAAYLNMFTRARYVGSNLRDRLSFLPRVGKVDTPAAWDLSAFSRACTRAAGKRHLDARGKALANRLLVEADKMGFPLDLLTHPTESAAGIDWQQRYAQTLIEVLGQVEQQWSNPKGMRRLVQASIVFLGDWAPLVALLGALIRLLWLYFVGDFQGNAYKIEMFDILLPVVVFVIVLIVLHLLIVLILPLRWSTIRGEFQRKLQHRLQAELAETYSPIPGDVADAVRKERRQVEQLVAETREVCEWLDQREHAANVEGLYGAESLPQPA